MAISKQIFNAPTPSTYNPSERIERSMSQLGQNIGGIIRQESERKQQEQANFAEIYANIGEIDAQLQENYAGIMQEAVTSTRDWIKNKYKEGLNSNDPEFVQGLSQRIGRIKAGMSNADRRRQEIQQVADLIKNDPSITDKTQAFTYAMSLANDPDFLISKNNTSLAEDVVSRFESPKAVVDNFMKTIRTDGVEQTDFTGKDGSLKRREVAYNRFIPKDNPVLEDGSPNVQVSLKDAQDLMQGKFGPSMLRVTDKIRQERYANDPVDVGYQKAMRDALMLSAGNNIKTTTVRSFYDIQKDKEADQLRREQLNLSKTREERLSGLGDEQEVNDRYQKFVEDYNQGKGVILSDYERPDGNIKDVEWQKNPVIEDLSSFDKWKSLSDSEKRKYIEEYGIDESKIPELKPSLTNPKSWVGGKNLNSKLTYDAVKSEFDQYDVPEITGIKFQVKEGTSGGKANWDDGFIEIKGGSEDDLKKAFKQLENTRVSGQGTRPVAATPEDDDLEGYMEYVID